MATRGVGAAIFLVVLLWGAASASAARADSCAKPPKPVLAILAQESDWSLVRLEDLQSDDKALWNAHRPQACPGFAAARLGVGSSPAYAIALWRATKTGKEEKIILLLENGGRPQDRILVKPFSTRNLTVVWRAGPGVTQAWDGGPKIKVATDSIIVETLESSAEQFFFVRGRLRSVWTSD